MQLLFNLSYHLPTPEDKMNMNYEILSATMVGRRRNFFIPNRLKRLEKLNFLGLSNAHFRDK